MKGEHIFTTDLQENHNYVYNYMSRRETPIHRLKGGLLMEKWVCTVCGYVYNPEEGDPDNDVAPGTAFEDLPEEWVCPDCGADKDMFEKE